MKGDRDKISSVKEFDKWLRERGFTRRESRALSFTFGRLFVTKGQPRNNQTELLSADVKTGTEMAR